MSTIASIRSKIYAQLGTAVGLPLVVYEGDRYERVANTPYVRVKLMPAETQNDSIGENWILTLSGLAQFDVFYPQMRGLTDASATAQLIVDTFSPTALVDGTQEIILDSVWIDVVREEPSWLHIPVILRWRAFSNK